MPDQGARPVLPGGTIGVLGGGQLGRMLALSAKRAGYRVHVLTDAAGSPAAAVADGVTVADYADEGAAAEFAKGVDVVTLEFENVSGAALEAAGRHAPVRPGPGALHVTQHRLREKEFLAAHGFPHAPFVALRRGAGLEQAPPYPFIAKTAGFGYDGKGQVRAAGPADLPAVAALARAGDVVLEAQVDLAAELSVVAARGADGAVALYAPFLNRHVGGVLDVTLLARAPEAPAADLPWERLGAEAAAAAAEVLDLLELVGVACVEFFVSTSGKLLVNEVAPRPHNSGHLTIEACVTSQFEQQWRAACLLPLGDPLAHSSAAMANLLGDLWAGGEPRWERALAVPGTALHLYGKPHARPGRKMGHVTALAAGVAEAERLALRARGDLLTGR